VKALVPALLCALLGLSWQCLTVHFNYGGNFTALFCTGSRFPTPPELAGERIYVFPNSGGYDGQSYHYVAHDPLRRTGIGRAVPDPEFRFPRILLPGLAHLLALGRPERIDASYFACNLLFLGLGAWWLAQLLIRMRVNPMFAVLYVFTPAAVISLDRMVVDLALVSLCLGFAVYAEAGSSKLYPILAAAALCRESGFLLTAAFALRHLAARRFREPLIFATALLPAIAWNLFVRAGIPGGAAVGLASFIPFWGLIHSQLHPVHYALPPLTTAIVRGFDTLEFAGLVFAIALAIALPFRDLRAPDLRPVPAACLLWALYGIVIPPGAYDDCYAGARILSPLLLFLFLRSLAAGAKPGCLPLLMVVPRVWLELAPQVLGIVGLARR
jgi:hypothetical protein